MSNRFKDADNIKQVIGEAVGAGSVCWGNVQGAGVFQSEEASNIVDEALAKIVELVEYKDDNVVTIAKQNREPFESDAYSRSQSLELAVKAGTSQAWDHLHVLMVAQTFEDWLLSGTLPTPK